MFVQLCVHLFKAKIEENMHLSNMCLQLLLRALPPCEPVPIPCLPNSLGLISKCLCGGGLIHGCSPKHGKLFIDKKDFSLNIAHYSLVKIGPCFGRNKNKYYNEKIQITSLQDYVAFGDFVHTQKITWCRLFCNCP